MLMPIERIPDWEKRLERQDAFFERAVIDRPVVCVLLWQPGPEYPAPAKTHATLRDRWMDTDYAVASALHNVMNTEYLGDGLPHCYPNLGPEVFSAFFGCELEFGEETSWSKPVLADWADVGKLRFSEDNVYWRKIVELTDAFLDAGEGKFYTGMTDFHPGGDAIAAFRDPLKLNYDMIERLDEVRALLAYVTEVYLKVFDYFYDKLRAANQAISTWAGPVSSKKWLVPSNDFSCMISPAMFDDVFLPSIIEECQHYDASLYHLDGPNALRHLDSLLAIEELSAIQWVYGAGNGRASDWIWVYRKCQAAGKGVEINIYPDELDTIMDALRPEGVWLNIYGVRSRDEAEALIRNVSGWRPGR
ncbi:MAG: trimethylamine corrinoid protein 2 [Armatimonadota bacterium]